MKAVIQCGGKGTRLMPYTTVLPKPLMPVGSRPVLELLLQWLRRSGIKEVYVTTGHLGTLIKTHCGNGQQWDMHIRYTSEPQPLGTIGPLTLLREALDETFLVLNGDVLTDLNLHALIDYHRARRGVVTIGTVPRTLKLDFGIIEQRDGRVVNFKEKPSLTQLVSMGVYCMEPSVFDHIPGGVPFGFDNLVLELLDKNIPVCTFRHDGLWLDVGRVDDFRRAQELQWEDEIPAYETVAA